MRLREPVTVIIEQEGELVTATSEAFRDWGEGSSPEGAVSNLFGSLEIIFRHYANRNTDLDEGAAAFLSQLRETFEL